MPNWTWAAASRVGTSHERTGSKRQDAFRCVLSSRRRSVLIAIACDGAGSSSHGGIGAALTSRHLSQAAKVAVKGSPLEIGDDQIIDWVDSCRDRIAATAKRHSLTPREFATTVVMIVTNGRESLVLHIGDGAIVGRDKATHRWTVLSWPENGEYASTTYFITDEAGAKARISRHTQPIDRLAVFTDGIERLALDLAATVPHEPFFGNISEPVANSKAKWLDKDLSGKLGQYLSSDTINARTDDDKTLILACLG
jgi:serine/threonine protein phosphatase PrpC